MKLSTFKNHLQGLTALNFVQPDGNFVPRHFHITEAGLVTKHFVDCGGKIRTEKNVALQIWVAGDVTHRLQPAKMGKILDIAAPIFGDADYEVEVEYQTGTVGKYSLAFSGENFILEPKSTACLASDACGIAPEELPVNAENKSACCTPGSGCC